MISTIIAHEARGLATIKVLPGNIGQLCDWLAGERGDILWTQANGDIGDTAIVRLSRTVEDAAGIRIAREDNELRITGSRACLRWIAGDIERQWEVSDRPAEIHFDYYEGHYYLDPNSLSLVVYWMEGGSPR